MKALMIYPNLESEKAIANYSIKLIDSINKTGIKMDSMTYTAGKPFSLFKKLSLTKDYDFVHIQHEYNLLGWYSAPFYALLLYLGIFKKNKLIVTMHTILSKSESVKGNFFKRFLRKYILYPSQNRLINNVSNCIVVHSEFFKKILIKEYSFNEKKVFVLPQGIEPIKLISKSAARKELKLSGNVFLMLGSFVPDHGADIVLKQAKKIGKTILVLINPNAVNDRNKKRIADWIEYNKKIIEENNFKKFVRFDIRSVPYDLWWKYISSADIILLPYRGGIGSGVVTDAIAAQKPVVASDIPFFREMKKNFNFLEIAENNEHYSKLVKQVLEKKKYSSMQAECKRYISEFGLSPLAEKYKKLYLSLK